jgi:hypothetical protein
VVHSTPFVFLAFTFARELLCLSDLGWGHFSGNSISHLITSIKAVGSARRLRICQHLRTNRSHLGAIPLLRKPGTITADTNLQSKLTFLLGSWILNDILGFVTRTNFTICKNAVGKLVQIRPLDCEKLDESKKGPANIFVLDD